SDRVLLDTRAHRDYFCETYGLAPGKFRVLPIGADDRVFRAAPEASAAGPARPFTVLHYGRFIRLHGLETVIRAARLLETEGNACRFLLVGDGEERPRIEALAREL